MKSTMNENKTNTQQSYQIKNKKPKTNQVNSKLKY